MSDSYVKKSYLQNQFKNYSEVIKDNFAKKDDVKAEKLEYTTTEDANVTNVKEALDTIFAGGVGDESGDENVIESISVNGTALTPDTDKNIDITIPTISSEQGNMIETKTDGIYVKDMYAKISSEEGNALISKSDGLYVHTTAETKVSAVENNQIVSKEDGIYVAPTDLTNYVEKVDGKGLSTNDLTDEMVEKLENTYTKDETYSRTEVDTAIANAQLSGGDVDLSAYATIEYVDNAVSNVDVDLTGYATETFVTDKIAEIEIPNLDGYAKTEDIPTVTNDLTDELKADYDSATTKAHEHTNAAVLDGITDTKVAEWDAKATESFVTNAIANAQLGEGSEVDLSGYATKDDLALKADTNHTHILTDITDYESPDLSDYALKTEIPSTDGFITEETLNTTLADYAKSEDITEYDDTALTERIEDIETALEGKADTSAIPDVSNFVEKEEGKGLFSGSYNDLTDQPTIPSVDGLVSTETLSTTLVDYVKSDELPDSYDDTALSNRVTTIEDDYLTSTDKTELTEAIATAKMEAIETILGESVSADFDTLQEVADWIQSDTTSSAELIARVTNAETDIDALETSITNKVDKVSGKGLSTNDLTTTLKTNYDTAYTHSQATHAPSDAEKNIIIGIQKNGTDVSVDSSTRKANITVPTKTSELTNDSGFKTTDNNTTYSLSKSGSTITLTGSDGSTTSVTDSDTNTTYGVVSTTADGLAPKRDGSTTKYLRADGTWAVPPDTNTTYNAATTSTNGLMTASMVTKLNGIASGANAYTLPTASSSTLGGVKTTSAVTSSSGYTACPIISGVPYYKPSSVTGGADVDIYQSNKILYGSGATSNSGTITWGDGSSTLGDFAMALGYHTTTNCASALAIGAYNNDNSSATNMSYYSWIEKDQSAKNAFIIGNGSETATGNAFRVTYAGATYGLSSFSSSGADYAEFVAEWSDGNTENEDRVGYFVTLKDNKLHKANDGDYILGVTSGNPSVVGNGDETYFWKYERDEFNRFIWEDTPLLDENGEEVIDENGNVVTGKTMKISDDYDSTQTYIARKDRPEWDYVGMIGVIPVRDDGTCIANGYCKCGTDGVATIAKSKDFFTYFVRERISDNVISVVIQ